MDEALATVHALRRATAGPSATLRFGQDDRRLWQLEASSPAGPAMRGSEISGKLKVLNSTLYLPRSKSGAGERESSRAMSIHPVMQRLADKLKRTDLPVFKAGDQIRVQVKIKEGDKERLQAFEGLVIAVKNGPEGSFTVRKMSFGQGVERIFPFNSKVVDKVEKIRSYRVRRAKLFYIRGLRGKAARMKEVARDKA